MGWGVRGKERHGAADRGSDGGAPDTAAARRMVPARFGDARLWLGIGLLAASMVIGARVLTSGDDTVTVWRVTRDLSVGSAATGLEPVAVGRTIAGDRYADPADSTEGVLRWPVAAGELLPLAALVPRPAQPTRQVTVPVDPLHAPADLQPGDLVDMWSTPRDDDAGGLPVETVTEPVLPGVSVTSVSTDALGVGGEVGVVLAVPQDRVGTVIAAIRSGVIDLVLVPIVSQDPAP
jgi:hypothetical protein